MATTTQIETEVEETANPQPTTFNLRQTFQDVPDQQQEHSEDTPDEDSPHNILTRAAGFPPRDYIPPLPGRSLSNNERKIAELEARLAAAHKTNADVWAMFNPPNPNPFSYTRIPLADKGKKPDRNPDGPSRPDRDPGNPGPSGSGGPGGPGGPRGPGGNP